MKKVFMSVAVATTVLLSSCGGTDMCSCMEMGEKMAEEMKATEGDADKMKAIEEKYKAEAEACEKLGKEMEEEMKDLSDEEKAKKAKEMMDACK